MPKNQPQNFPARLSEGFSFRTLVLGLAVGAIFVSLSPEGFGQASAKPAVAVIKSVTLNTADGWTIPITYYQSTQGKDASIIILLHGEGDNQLVWKQKTGLAARLHAENFAVIICDLRKHGEAKNPRSEGDKKLNAADFKAMSSASKFSELEVIQDFLYQEHQASRLNMAKLGILAVDNVAPVALNWAANDWTKKPYQDAPSLEAMTPRGQTVRAIALVSPTETVPGVSSTAPLRFFKMLNGTPVSLLFMSGQDDARDMKNMVKLVSTPKNQSVVFSEAFPTKLKGADLFGRMPKADPLVVGFFKKQLQELNVDWRDRRSRLER